MAAPTQYLADEARPVGAESVENAGLKMGQKTVRILLPLPLADAYDYSVPDGIEVAPGNFVVKARNSAPGGGCFAS